MNNTLTVSDIKNRLKELFENCYPLKEPENFPDQLFNEGIRVTLYGMLIWIEAMEKRNTNE